MPVDKAGRCYYRHLLRIAEYGAYRKAVAEWEKLTGEKVDDRLRAKLQQKQKESKEHNRHIEHHKKNDRGQGSIRSGVGNCSAFALLKYINLDRRINGKYDSLL